MVEGQAHDIGVESAQRCVVIDDQSESAVVLADEGPFPTLHFERVTFILQGIFSAEYGAQGASENQGSSII